ncbi:MAG: hypothetical protein GW749_00780 [Alphaproteobacteria bacterium]|nr:hypothetical protein [Alphaproteobacteria bacterium]
MTGEGEQPIDTGLLKAGISEHARPMTSGAISGTDSAFLYAVIVANNAL